MIHHSPKALAEEAREALRRVPLPSSQEQFEELVRLGWINRRGEVTRLLGGKAEPEPEAIGVPADDENEP
jgi:hypothetical protein